MGYRIAKSIKPPKELSGTRKGKYPWPNMKVGNSILVSADEANKAKNAARNFGQRHGVEFTWQVWDDSGSVRIWRIK